MFPRSLMIAASVLAVLMVVAGPAVAQTEGQPPATGIVVSVDGEAFVDREGEREPVVEGYVLEYGDVIIVRAGARCTGFTPGGEPFRLEGPAEFRLPASAEQGLLDLDGDVNDVLVSWKVPENAFTAQPDSERTRNDLHVQGERPVVDVPDVQPELLLPGDGVPPVDLGPAGAGLLAGHESGQQSDPGPAGPGTDPPGPGARPGRSTATAGRRD